MNINVYEGRRISYAYGKLASQALMIKTTIQPACIHTLRNVHYLFVWAISDKTRQPNLFFPRPAVLDHAAAGAMGNFRLQ